MQFQQPDPAQGQPVQPNQFQPGQPYPPGTFVPPPTPKKKGNPFLIGCLGVFGFFVVLGVIGNLAGGGKGSQTSTSSPSSSSRTTTNTSSKDASEPAVIRLSANDLAAAYNANEVSADDKYKDKIVEVTGTVDSIGKDITDTSYVTLAASGDFLGVQCSFDDQYKGALAKLHKGQQIRLRGTCKGKVMNVTLADCVPN